MEPQVTHIQPTAERVEDKMSKTLTAAHDVDGALHFLSSVDIDEDVGVDDKKLMRRVDLLLMPLMFACYYLQYTDKTLCMSISEWVACI